MARNGEEFDEVYKKSIEKMMKYHIYLLRLATETFHNLKQMRFLIWSQPLKQMFLAC